MRLILVLTMVLMTAWPSMAAGVPESGYLAQGAELLASGKYRQAVAAFEEASRVNPRSVEAQMGVGTSWQKLGDNGIAVNAELLQRAAAAFRRALDLDPGQAEVRLQLGVTLLALGDREGAAREQALLADLDPVRGGELSARIDAAAPSPRYRDVGGTSEKGRNGKAPPAQAGGFAGTVDVYGADWCPYSRAAVKYLQGRGIPHVYHEIDKDAAAKSAYRALGAGGIPLIAINGRKVMSGFSPQGLEYHLARSR
jgi:glutaredoxin